MTRSEHKFSRVLSLEAGLTVPFIFKQKYLPSLNGLRAVAILLVLADHLRYTTGYPRIFSSINGYLSLGSFGVQIFFVLSGFLITGLLLKEKVLFGSIRIKWFWWRRVLRILPAFYFFLLTILVLTRLNIAVVSDRAMAAAALFVSNIGNWHSEWLIVHSWTLSVEEQFYLCLPLLIVFMPRRFYLAGMLILIYHIFYYYLRQSVFLFPLRFFLIPAVPLMTGAMLAIALYKGWLTPYQVGLTKPVAGFSLVFAIACYLPRTFQFAPFYYRPFDYLFSSIFIALFIFYVMHCRPDNWIRQLLNIRVMSYIGALSYSIYLWQQLFLAPASNFRVFPYWTIFPWNIAATFVAAMFSYYLVEQPFLKLKKKIR